MSNPALPPDLAATLQAMAADIERLQMTARTTSPLGLALPTMTQAQRLALPTRVGLVVYQTDGTEGIYLFKSTGWALNA